VPAPAELVEKDQRSLEVSVADKIQNAQTTLADLKSTGVALWLDFNEKRPEAQLCYYTSLVKVFEDRIPDHPLTSRMSAVVEAMERQVLQEVPHLADRRPWSAPVDVS
jgi:hypothetical protein